MSLIKAKQIDLTTLTSALNITAIARNAISVQSNSLLSYNSTTGVLGYQGYISSKTIIVDKDSPNATDVRTSISRYNFDFPFVTIQAAINASTNGDLILVYSNTYTEDISLSGVNKLYVIEFQNVTLNGNITLTNDLNSLNIVSFTKGSNFVGNLIVDSGVLNPVLISDGTGEWNGKINKTGSPSNVYIQGFRQLLYNSAFYSGSTTITSTPELIFKDIELIKGTGTNLFSAGNYSFDNCYVLQSTLTGTDSIFLNGGPSFGASKTTFESVTGKIQTGTTSFWFYNIENSTFKSGDVCFDIKASVTGNKKGYFINSTFYSGSESIFKFSTNTGGRLILIGCIGRVINVAKYFINNTTTIDSVESTNLSHSSALGFFTGTVPDTYLNNNTVVIENL
jgi:hypothetical protein